MIFFRLFYWGLFLPWLWWRATLSPTSPFGWKTATRSLTTATATTATTRERLRPMDTAMVTDITDITAMDTDPTTDIMDTVRQMP